MATYTDKQKLDAVKAYRKGSGGLRATAEAQGVHVDSLRKWVAGYRALGAAGIVSKKRTNYGLEFKLEVLRRMDDDGISCRQAAALFDIRRPDQVAKWRRVLALHGAAALQPGWRQQTKMIKRPRQQNGEGAPADDQRTREDLLHDVQQLRMEIAYLKKAQALARTRKRSAPVKGRRS